MAKRPDPSPLDDLDLELPPVEPEILDDEDDDDGFDEGAEIERRAAARSRRRRGGGNGTVDHAAEADVLSALPRAKRWTVRRIGPGYHNGHKVPLGIYPVEKFSGPVSAEAIGNVLGGGVYEVLFDGDARWRGPIEVMGDPRLDVGLRVPAPPTDFRAASVVEAERGVPAGHEDDEDAWVMVYDAAYGFIRRRRRDVERDDQRLRQAATHGVDDKLKAEIEAIRRETKDAQLQMTQALAQLAQAITQPREDPMRQFLQAENTRIEQRRKEREEELKEQRAEAERRRQHELELAEKRLAEERTRAERAHEMLMEHLVKNRPDPLAQISALIGSFKHVQEALGLEGGAGSGDAGEKTTIERVIEQVGNGLQKVFPTVQPLVEHAVQNYLSASQRPKPPAQLPAPPASTGAGSADGAAGGSTQATSAAAARAQEEATMVGRLLRELKAGIESEAPVEQVWDSILRHARPAASMIAAYESTDAFVEDLRTLPSSRLLFRPHAATVSAICDLAIGAHRAWTDRFLAHARAQVAQDTGES